MTQTTDMVERLREAVAKFDGARSVEGMNEAAREIITAARRVAALSQPAAPVPDYNGFVPNKYIPPLPKGMSLVAVDSATGAFAYISHAGTWQGMPNPIRPSAAPVPDGMVPWTGGDRAPEDWDGGQVLFRKGTLSRVPTGAVWKLGWGHYYGPGDVIAYTPKPKPKPAARLSKPTKRMEQILASPFVHRGPKRPTNRDAFREDNEDKDRGNPVEALTDLQRLSQEAEAIERDAEVREKVARIIEPNAAWDADGRFPPCIASRKQQARARAKADAILDALPSLEVDTGLMRQAIADGLRGWASSTPDIDLSRSMCRDAADHIIAEPALFAALSTHQPDDREMPTIWEDPAGKGYPCFERPMTAKEARETIDRYAARIAKLEAAQPDDKLVEALAVFCEGDVDVSNTAIIIGGDASLHLRNARDVYASITKETGK